MISRSMNPQDHKSLICPLTKRPKLQPRSRQCAKCTSAKMAPVGKCPRFDPEEPAKAPVKSTATTKTRKPAAGKRGKKDDTKA